MEPYSVYIHIPFCLHRCAYCDFNTYAGQGHLISDYVDALVLEIQSLRKTGGRSIPVHSIYFGGGTPSLLPPVAVGKVLKTLGDSFDLLPGIEITLEANPGTLSQSYLQDLSTFGVNRLSLGMQSAHPVELNLLERQHHFEDVLESAHWAQEAGIQNLSLDLIFGLPGQRTIAWSESLSKAIDLAPKHLSLYALTIEPGTPMDTWVSRGLITVPEPDLAADMYELASEKLDAEHYMQYEISSWAKADDAFAIRDEKSDPAYVPGYLTSSWTCTHNLQYWRNQPYFGFGAGAHGYVNGMRIANVLTPQAYIESMIRPAELANYPRTPATVRTQSIDLQTEMNETMMMGLRLTMEGVSRSKFQARFRKNMIDVYGKQIQRLEEWGLLEWVGRNLEILRLTSHGRLLGNKVFGEFV
jgi:oxygen-independent coproporphyrinogen-3 oxidase